MTVWHGVICEEPRQVAGMGMAGALMILAPYFTPETLRVLLNAVAGETVEVWPTGYDGPRWIDRITGR